MTEMIALFEQAYHKLAGSVPSAEEETSHERSSLCNNMAQYIPTAVEYTFTLLNSDTYALTLTYAPNQVGTHAFIYECKQQLTKLTGYPVGRIDIYHIEGSQYTVVLDEEVPMVALGEICDIQRGTRITRETALAGDIPVYGSRSSPYDFTTAEPNRTGKSLVIPCVCLTSLCVRVVDHPFFLKEDALTLHSKNEDTLLPEYLNIVMLAMQDDVFNTMFRKGDAYVIIKSFLKRKKLQALNLPLPPLCTQRRLIQEHQTIDTHIHTIRERIKGDEQRIRDLQQLKKDVIASIGRVA